MDQPHSSPHAGLSVRRLIDSAGALPEVDPHTARLLRLLCDARVAARIAQEFHVTDWRVTHEAPVRWQMPGWIDLQRGRSTASFGVDLALYPGLASTVTESDASSDAALAASLRHAVAAILLAPLLEVLSALGATDAYVTGLRCGSPPPTTLMVQFERGPQRFECALGAIDRGWIEPLEQQIATQRVPFAACVSQIGVPAWLCIGEKALNVKTLNGLRAGDVILRAAPASLRALFATPQHADHADMYWGVPGARQLYTSVMLNDRRLLINTDPQMTQDTSRNDSALTGTDTPNTASIDELDLPVRFEIETVTLPLVQVSALRAGYVIELPSNVRDARVRLVSYGQTIGTGELVTVGEHLGVRIVQMSNGNDSI
ncbi:type III secretion system cytoplasmic ring protein SctQ [Paraburkholderia rhizosphaerae]|uniref:Type III secretion system apparatus protein YscQ/HrcQ n=1 Tax=Paraburkholderia rhizosphaerae TaxID=480658 RepID=A0A4R8LKR5_9BURK|nr:type III secretion system cytoplasmic ring protein SctQ [Paraburkholderia rhizosphaerae]TDY45167.1 type III secretion system apparatus protein YscQ/HrcQ [Paraburkholderia rhizosphaerae]